MPTDLKTSGPLRAIAIDPGAQELGYAVLEACELLYFGVHTFKPAARLEDLVAEAEKIIGNLIQTYHPDLFVSEKTQYPGSRRTPLVHLFVKRLTVFATRQKLSVVSYLPIRVKEAFTGNVRVSRRSIAELLVRDWFPFLKPYLVIDQESGQKYWQNAFDAIALGLLAVLERSSPEERRRLLG